MEKMKSAYVIVPFTVIEDGKGNVIEMIAGYGPGYKEKVKKAILSSVKAEKKK